MIARLQELPRQLPLCQLLLAAAVCGGVAATCSAQAIPQPSTSGYGSPFNQPYGYVVGAGTKFRMVFGQDRVEFVGPLDQQFQVAYSATNAMQLSITANMISHFGYHPLHATVRLPARAARDRTIRIRFFAGERGMQSTTAERTVVLKRGKQMASATWYVPQYENWRECQWEAIVDGQFDRELSATDVGFPQPPTIMGVAGLLVSAAINPTDVEPGLLALGSGSATLQTRRPRDLPTSWVGYTMYDVVVIKAEELVGLAQAFPRQASALDRWLRAGGNLWLLGAGQRWEKLRTAEKALGVDLDVPMADAVALAAPRSDREADESIVARGWRFATIGERATEPAEGAARFRIRYGRFRGCERSGRGRCTRLGPQRSHGGRDEGNDQLRILSCEPTGWD